MRSIPQTSSNTVSTLLQGDLKEGDHDEGDDSAGIDEEGRGYMHHTNRQNPISTASVSGPPVAMIALLFTPLKDLTPPPIVPTPSAAATAVTFLNNVTANVTNAATNVATNVTTAVTSRMRANTNPGSRRNSMDPHDGQV